MGSQGTVVHHTFIEERRRQAIGEHGVDEQVLWLQGRGRAALLHLGPGALVPAHSHANEVHHIWVVSGSCVLGEHATYAGSYLFVPTGVEHGARAGFDGCTLFYLFLPAIED